jgi:hypothetical protein
MFKAAFEKEKELAMREIADMRSREMNRIASEKELLERRRLLLDSDYTKRSVI